MSMIDATEVELWHEPKGCRHIQGDPAGRCWWFCQCRQLEGSSYCAAHHARHYVKAAKLRIEAGYLKLLDMNVVRTKPKTREGNVLGIDAHIKGPGRTAFGCESGETGHRRIRPHWQPD